MKILLVDDHPLFLAGITAMFKAWGVEVAGHANNGKEAIAKVRELRPDIVFMDITMPELNGLEATRIIKTEFPETKVIIITVSDDEKDLFEAIKSGAEGYLLKNVREDDFADLIARLRHDEPIMSPGLAMKVLREFAYLKSAHDIEAEPSLTERERSVLEKVAQGATNKAIACSLHISENTVTFHMKNIFTKLHLRNRAGVVAWAFEHGVVKSPV